MAGPHAEECENTLLRVGEEVRAPGGLERVIEMRCGWQDTRKVLGRVGLVERTEMAFVVLNFGSESYKFDYDTFGDEVTRMCFMGCLLTRSTTTKPIYTCDSCLSQIPTDAPLLTCSEHKFDLCLSCAGLPISLDLEQRVTRGPTWKWNNQDGGAYKEGRIIDLDTNGHWVEVLWASGEVNKYRTGSYQDVVPVYGGGIVVNEKLEEMKQLNREARKGQEEAQQAALQLAAAKALPKKVYNPSKGFHFAEILKNASVSDDCRTATSTKSNECTVVTKEVLDADDMEAVSCSFTIERQANGPVGFGVTDGSPVGFTHHALGTGAFRGTTGLISRSDGCIILSMGKVTELPCPELQEGDTVGVTVDDNGCIIFSINGVVVNCSFSVPSTYRFGASLTREGQRVAFLSVTDCPKPSTWVDRVRPDMLTAQKLPFKPLSPSRGFTMISSDSSTVTNSGKRVTITSQSQSTVVTKETMTSGTGNYTIYFSIERHGSGVCGFGVTPETPVGFDTQTIGLLKGSIALMARGPALFMLANGEGSRIEEAPVLQVGDVVSVRVSWAKKIVVAINDITIPQCTATVEGGFRFGLSLTDACVEVVRPATPPPPAAVDVEAQVLTIGSCILTPHESRLIPESHAGLCGLPATIESLDEAVNLRIFGEDMCTSWDYYLFDKSVERHCPIGGCVLQEYHMSCATRACDGCGLSCPAGSDVYCCPTHDFDLCLYCMGHKTEIYPGLRVVRGPTWTWGDQDGRSQTTNERAGTVTAVNSNGWCSVEWDCSSSGKVYQYRPPPYQDVTPLLEGFSEDEGGPHESASQGSTEDNSAGQHLKASYEIRAPCYTPRIKLMTCSYSAPMRGVLGKIALVAGCYKDMVKLNFGLQTYVFDYNVFPQGVKRYCYADCPLTTSEVTSQTHYCGACYTQLPVGSTVHLCVVHNFDLCQYCNGTPEAIEVGCEVVRGPTWRHQEEDILPFNKGKVVQCTDSHVHVRWEGNENVRTYRTYPYADVWPAHMGCIYNEQIATLRRCPIPQEDITTYDLPVDPPGEQGFTFSKLNTTVEVSCCGKLLTAGGRPCGTAVTDQVSEASEDRVACYIKIVNIAASGGIVMGITDETPVGFLTADLGHVGDTLGFKSTIDGCSIDHARNSVQLPACPKLQEGDVIGLAVLPSTVLCISVNGRVVNSQFTVKDLFRFGVSLLSENDKVEIVCDPAFVPKVPLPLPNQSFVSSVCKDISIVLPKSSVPLIEAMECYEEECLKITEQAGVISSVTEGGVTVRVDGLELLYAMYVIPVEYRRRCWKGCCLKRIVVVNDSTVCGGCGVDLPLGSVVMSCSAHQYLLCPYCNGVVISMQPGMRVIRGPTWKWGEQDGGAGEEGVITEATESVYTVRWDKGGSNQYRGSVWMDVMPAFDGGTHPVDRPSSKSPARRHDSPLKISRKAYDPIVGLHFIPLHTVELSDDCKTATSRSNEPFTLLTKEVIDVQDGEPASCNFLVKALSPGCSMAFGITDDTPVGYQTHPLGCVEMKGTLGLLITPEGSRLLHGGEAACLQCPRIDAGCIVTVAIDAKGGISILVNGTVVSSQFTVRNTYRFAVTFFQEGCCVGIVSKQSNDKPDRNVVRRDGKVWISPGDVEVIPFSEEGFAKEDLQSLEQLRHPNVLPVFSTSDNSLFTLPSDPLPPLVAAKQVRDVLSGVLYLISAGLTPGPIGVSCGKISVTPMPPSSEPFDLLAMLPWSASEFQNTITNHFKSAASHYVVNSTKFLLHVIDRL
eukprot:TRINITY_DN33643_c0_g1_i1.p1 TRINITY_DN33643_c0_g1~~TRINITY_DN33643_c0_g1_i1.p1  ORF type:complete len:1753 (+),score=267.63 TRINITY_DN33643_c0_g1_i1:37-5295(+)